MAVVALCAAAGVAAQPASAFAGVGLDAMGNQRLPSFTDVIEAPCPDTADEPPITFGGSGTMPDGTCPAKPGAGEPGTGPPPPTDPRTPPPPTPEPRTPPPPPPEPGTPPPPPPD